MIGEALSHEIDVFAAGVRSQNPLFVQAEAGSLSLATVARYIANVHQLIRHTPYHLGKARDLSMARGDDALARHFAHKMVEEAGHDAWAARDLEGLSRRGAPPPSDKVTPAMGALIRHIESLIDEDPALYLSYILFAEKLVVLMGPEWLALLESRCGIPKSLLTIIGNHAELDKDHVSEALDEIDALVGDPKKLPAMRDALRRSMDRFAAFCSELASSELASMPSESDADRESAKQIAAA